MTMFAIVRPDDWNLPLFVHVLGALVLVGALFTAALVLFHGRGELVAARAGYKTLLYAALPAAVVMRVGAQWIANKEGLEDSEAAWIGIGYITAEAGLLLLIVATVVAGLAVRKASAGEGLPGKGVAVAAYIVAFLIVVDVVAIWAMATKPA